MAANRAKIDGFLSKMRPTIFVLKFWFACDIMNKTGDNLPDKSEFDEVILWLFHVERKEFQKLIHI